MSGVFLSVEPKDMCCASQVPADGSVSNGLVHSFEFRG